MSASMRKSLLAARAEIDAALAQLPDESTPASPPPAESRYMGVVAFALKRGVSPTTVRKWIRLGLPIAPMPTKVIRIKVAEAEAWLLSTGSQPDVRALVVQATGAQH